MFLLSMNIITTFSVLSTNCYGTKNVERPRYIIPLRISIQSTIRCLYRTKDIIKNLTGRKRNFYIILVIMKIITCQFLCKPTSRTKRKYNIKDYISQMVLQIIRNMSIVLVIEILNEYLLLRMSKYIKTALYFL